MASTSFPAARRLRILGILDAYVLRHFLGSYAICVGTGLGLFIIGDIFDRISLYKDEPIGAIVDYYAARLPVVYYHLGPFMTLAGAMFAVARLERANELLAMKAAGISVFRAILPVLVGAAALAVIGALDQELLIPRLAERLRSSSVIDRDDPWFEPGIFRDKYGNVLWAARYYPGRQALAVVTFRLQEDGVGRETIHAARARWIPEGRRRGYWLLEEGVRRERPAAGEDVPYRERRFGRGLPADPADPKETEGLPLRTSIYPVDIEIVASDVSYLSYRDLDAQRRRHDYLPRLGVLLHARVADPAAHVVLCFIGLPFVLGADRSRGGRGIFAGLLALVVLCAGFFVLAFMLRDLGEKGVLGPALAVWLPVGIFGAGGLLNLLRVQT